MRETEGLWLATPVWGGHHMGNHALREGETDMAESYDMMILQSGKPRTKGAEYGQMGILGSPSVITWIDGHPEKFNSGEVWFAPSDPSYQCAYSAACTNVARDILRMPYGLVDVCHKCRAFYERMSA